jgi:hypothetical protein
MGVDNRMNKRERREALMREMDEEAARYNALSIAEKIREASTLHELKEALATYFEQQE